MLRLSTERVCIHAISKFGYSKAFKIWGKYHIPDRKHDMEAPTVSGCGIESGVVTMVLTFEGGQSTTTKDA
jgi:hypothetical protein